MASSAHNWIFRTGEPAYAVDRSGTVLAWNDAAVNLFGFSAKRAIGKHCWKLLGGRDLFGNPYCCRHCVLREIAFRDQPVNRSSLSFRRANGESVRCTVSTLLVRDAASFDCLIHLCRREVQLDTAPVDTSMATNKTRQSLLTRREMEVLKRLADGHGTDDIGTLLGISPVTVRNHVEHVMAKLNVHSRLAAVATARRLGII